jgi:hypothetical protein
VRVFCAGQYVTPWRKSDYVQYEALNGKPTPDFE